MPVIIPNQAEFKDSLAFLGSMHYLEIDRKPKLKPPAAQSKLHPVLASKSVGQGAGHGRKTSKGKGGVLISEAALFTIFKALDEMRNTAGRQESKTQDPKPPDVDSPACKSESNSALPPAQQLYYPVYLDVSAPSLSTKYTKPASLVNDIGNAKPKQNTPSILTRFLMSVCRVLRRKGCLESKDDLREVVVV